MKRVKEVDWRGGGERGRGAGQPGKREKEVKEREGEGEEFFSPDNGLNFVGPKKSRCLYSRERARKKIKRLPSSRLGPEWVERKKKRKNPRLSFFTLLFSSNKKPQTFPPTFPPLPRASHSKMAFALKARVMGVNARANRRSVSQ